VHRRDIVGIIIYLGFTGVVLATFGVLIMVVLRSLTFDV
jgi:hypothetical protein